ncbi:MAG: hypothetical protein KatS3mg111_3601 [Pirellulaceae bacterium]|nr:MAG: hypothetical protein KatS3mg111_3601 [Pirellulaceae bacterium]
MTHLDPFNRCNSFSDRHQARQRLRMHLAFSRGGAWRLASVVQATALVGALCHAQLAMGQGTSSGPSETSPIVSTHEEEVTAPVRILRFRLTPDSQSLLHSQLNGQPTVRAASAGEAKTDAALKRSPAEAAAEGESNEDSRLELTASAPNAEEPPAPVADSANNEQQATRHTTTDRSQPPRLQPSSQIKWLGEWRPRGDGADPSSDRLEEVDDRVSLPSSSAHQEGTEPSSRRPRHLASSPHKQEAEAGDRSRASARFSAPSSGEESNQRKTTECPGSPDNSVVNDPVSSPPDDDDAGAAHPMDAPHAIAQLENDPTTAPAEVFTTQEILLRNQIHRCLQFYLDHPENVVRRGPWALMHATLPFGAKTEVIAGSRRVNAIGWMCYNGVCARQRMFQPTRSGFVANVGPGVQGHEGQFLAILAQSRVPSDFPLRIGNRSYTVEDLVRYEMVRCRERSELTFKLIGLSFYLDQDARWRDSRGHTWTLEKLLVEEMGQPIHGAACGGTHRLMGLSYAIIRRNKAGYPITGNWAKAEEYLNEYVNYTMKLQNPDGSFSTNWFEGRGADPDIERKVQTTGHITEWLVYTLPDEFLRTDRIQAAVQFLASSIGAEPQRDWPIGPRGHALRAMALYNQRVFGIDPWDDLPGSDKSEDVASSSRQLELR